MGNFELVVLVSYLYAIFLLVLRAKISHKNIRWFKILLVMLFVAALYYLIADSATTTALLPARIIVFIPLGYVLIIMFINEISSVFKRMEFLKKRSVKNRKTNNDLATKLGSAIEFLASRKIGL